MALQTWEEQAGNHKAFLEYLDHLETRKGASPPKPPHSVLISTFYAVSGIAGLALYLRPLILQILR